MTRSGILPLLTLLLAVPLGGAAPEPGVTSEWVGRFEQSLDLNAILKNDGSYRGPLALESYARYYDIGEVDGVAFVLAGFAPPLERHPEDWTSCTYRDGAFTDCGPVEQPTEDQLRSRGRGVHLNRRAPEILDGGCGVVTLWIEPQTLRVAGAYCNGLA